LFLGVREMLEKLLSLCVGQCRVGLTFERRAIFLVGSWCDKDDLCSGSLGDGHHPPKIQLVMGQHAGPPLVVAMIVRRTDRMVEDFVDFFGQHCGSRRWLNGLWPFDDSI